MHCSTAISPVVAALLFNVCCGCSSSPGPVDSGVTCPTGSGPTNHQDTITTDTTWTAAASPHVVTFGITIAPGATLTLEPCAEIRLQADHGLDVRGRLVAEGTPQKPIHFTADDPAHPWSFIGFNSGTGSLASVLLENGGSPADPNGKGLIDVRGDPSLPRQELLKVNQVTLKGSGTAGLSLRDGATLTHDSSGLTISGAVGGAIVSAPRLAGNIPSGTYTGNTPDGILITDDEYLSEDTVLHARGVPYLVGATDTGQLRIGDDSGNPKHAVLTIEAGVTIKVGQAGRITTGSSANPPTSWGAIVANGSAASPITFTSLAATPAAGDWVGILFGRFESTDHFDHVVVEYTGAPSQASGAHCNLSPNMAEGDDAAVVLFGTGWSEFITNSTFRNGTSYGIDRAWDGAPVDFQPTNTFDALGRCNQSVPRDAQGSCPSSVTCF